MAKDEEVEVWEEMAEADDADDADEDAEQREDAADDGQPVETGALIRALMLVAGVLLVVDAQMVEVMMDALAFVAGDLGSSIDERATPF